MGKLKRDDAGRVPWRLVPPPPAPRMEYMVDHELCHLIERNHSDRLWRTLGEVMADWPERKALLERWEREQAIEGREVWTLGRELEPITT